MAEVCNHYATIRSIHTVVDSSWCWIHWPNCFESGLVLDPTIYELEKKENKSPPSCWKETAIKEAYIIQWRNLMFILCWVFRSGPPPVFTTLDNLVLLLLVAELPPRVQATLPVLHIVRCNPIPIAVIIIQNKENGVWKLLWLARMENHQVESTGNKRTNATFKYRNDLLKPNMATTWKTLDVSFFFFFLFFQVFYKNINNVVI